MPSAVMLPLLLGTAFALQPPGAFHGDEVSVRDGESWLALQVRGDSAALVQTTLILRSFEDLFVDAPGERSGIEVTSSDPSGVVAFVRGDALHTGPIELAQVDAKDGAWSPSDSIRITFRGLGHRIETTCASEPSARIEGQAQYACDVMLRTPDTSQVLARRVGYYEPGSDVMSWGDDGVQKLLFAGDIDGDGRLDLIYDTSDHYNKSRPTLFLSTQAAEGALIGEVALHESLGC